MDGINYQHHQQMGGFLKWGYPYIIHFNRIFHCKPSMWRYPHLWKNHMAGLWHCFTNIRSPATPCWDLRCFGRTTWWDCGASQQCDPRGKSDPEPRKIIVLVALDLVVDCDVYGQVWKTWDDGEIPVFGSLVLHWIGSDPNCGDKGRHFLFREWRVACVGSTDANVAYWSCPLCMHVPEMATVMKKTMINAYI